MPWKRNRHRSLPWDDRQVHPYQELQLKLCLAYPELSATFTLLTPLGAAHSDCEYHTRGKVCRQPTSIQTEWTHLYVQRGAMEETSHPRLPSARSSEGILCLFSFCFSATSFRGLFTFPLLGIQMYIQIFFECVFYLYLQLSLSPFSPTRCS